MEINRKYVPSLKDDIKISKLDDNSNSYILYFEKTGQSLKINENIKIIFNEINGVQSLEEIFNTIALKIIPEYEDFEKIFTHIFIEKCIIKGTVNLKKEKSIFLFRIEILNEKVIDRIFLFTKWLSNNYFILSIIFLYLITRLVLYFLLYHKVSITDFTLGNIIALYFFTFITIFFHELGHTTFSALSGIKSKFHCCPPIIKIVVPFVQISSQI